MGRGYNGIETDQLVRTLSTPMSEFSKAITNHSHRIKDGMQKYLAMFKSPHCFVLAYATSDEGFDISKISEIKETKIEQKSFDDIINDLTSYKLIYRKGNHIYPTDKAFSILK